MFEWGLIWAFLLWPVAPLLWWRQRSNSTTATLWLPFAARWRDAQQHAGAVTQQKRHWPWWPLLIWTIMIGAAAQPQFVGEPVAQQRSGRDMMLVVDLSGSMEATDLVQDNAPVTRLDVLQKVLSEFIVRRHGDRLGLVLFGEQAYLQAPLTFDHKTVAQFLQESVIGLAGARRTAIGDGLAMGVKYLQESTAEKKAIILVTDGANNGGQLTPEQGSELAQKAGVVVYTIGVGGGEKILRDPFFGTRKVNPAADLDEPALQRIADQTGGRYFRARDVQDLEQIYRTVDQLEPHVSADQWQRPVKALYFWPLSLALALWLLQLLYQIFLPHTSQLLSRFYSRHPSASQAQP